MLSKFNSIAWGTRFEAGPENMAVGIRHCNQEVGSGLTVRRLESHVDKILPRPVCRAEIGHLAFVDNADLVEQTVQ